jgi:type 1 fimbriae regulatory protein FimB/type 1 fimbriae regulatory protein FimE
MASSNSVVTIDRRYFGRKVTDSRTNTNKIGRNSSRLTKNKLYKHSSKEALTSDQIEQLVAAALHSPRNGVRDAAIILLAYRHGFKVSELINLKWEHIDFDKQSILVSRLCNGQETLQPLQEREINLLRQLEKQNSELVFQSLRKNQMSSTNIRKIIKLAGKEAGFKKAIYPDMLSGASGFDLISATIETSVTRH